MTDALLHFEGKVTAMEIVRDEKYPNHVGVFRVAIEPIGLTISGIRVSQNREGRIKISLPAERRGGEWLDHVKLGPALHGALKAAIFRELKERGLMPPRQDAQPARGWNDEEKWDDAKPWSDEAAEPDADIPLPPTVLNQ